MRNDCVTPGPRRVLRRNDCHDRFDGVAIPLGNYWGHHLQPIRIPTLEMNDGRTDVPGTGLCTEGIGPLDLTLDEFDPLVHVSAALDLSATETVVQLGTREDTADGRLATQERELQIQGRFTGLGLRDGKRRCTQPSSRCPLDAARSAWSLQSLAILPDHHGFTPQ